MRRRSGLAATAVAALAASLMLGGCVSLPTSGTALGNTLPNSELSQGNQVGMVPRPPGPQWTQEQIVRGFLAASGANLRVARQYLTAAYSASWHPISAPQVIDTASKVAPAPIQPSHVIDGLPAEEVTVTSQHLETLVAAARNLAGRLQVWPTAGPYMFKFALTQVSGKWRIDGISGADGKPSDTILLLTNADFLRDYQPRNLYFPASGLAGALVPYPVYIPDSTTPDGVEQLVDALLTLPPPSTNWLYRDVTTAFPRGTQLSMQVSGSQAVIRLGGAAVRASYETLQLMKAQLVWTLTYPPYSTGTTGIGSVSLQVGNRAPLPLVLPRAFGSWIPQSPAAAESLYYQGLNRAGRPVLEAFKPGNAFRADAGAGTGKRQTTGASPKFLPGGLGRGRFTAIAISPASPAGEFPPTFAGCRGKTVYVAPLLLGSRLLSQSLGADCTSMSWDDVGDLFVTAGTNVFEVTEVPDGLRVVPVTIPAPQIPDADTFAAVKVAPDGLRVAMIVQGKTGGGVFVAAIHNKGSLVYMAQSGQLLTVGPDVANPVALTWWDADHLLVLGRRNGVPELRLVPLDGGESQRIQVPPGTVSVTANGSIVAIGTVGRHGRGSPHILIAHQLDGFWQPVSGGADPAYPG